MGEYPIEIKCGLYLEITIKQATQHCCSELLSTIVSSHQLQQAEQTNASIWKTSPYIVPRSFGISWWSAHPHYNKQDCWWLVRPSPAAEHATHTHTLTYQMAKPQGSNLDTALHLQGISECVYADVVSVHNSTDHNINVQHFQSNHLKPASNSTLPNIWTWPKPCLCVCVYVGINEFSLLPSILWNSPYSYLSWLGIISL